MRILNKPGGVPASQPLLAYRDAVGQGLQALASGALVEAIHKLRAADDLSVDDPVAGLNLILALRRNRDQDGALALAGDLVRRFPARWEPAREFGRLLQAQGQWQGAEQQFRRSLALHPAQADLWNDLGMVLVRLGQLDAADQCYQQALQQAPDLLIAQANRAELRLERRDYPGALAGFMHLLRHAPDDCRLMVKIATCHRRAGALAQAEEWLRRAIQVGDSGRAHSNLGFLLLSQGRYRDGWAAYRRRDAGGDAPAPIMLPAGGLRGCRIRFLPDQGLGDELFFARFLPLLAARGADYRFVPQPKMAPLLRRCPALAGKIDAPDWPALPDLTLPISDIAYLIGHCEEDGEPPSLRLAPLPDKLRQADQLLGDAAGQACLGVAWRGGLPDRPAALTKVIAPAALGQAVRDFPGRIVLLQRDPDPAEIAAFDAAAGRPVIDASHVNDDLELMLALLSRLNHLASVSNTNIHLRALLGGDGHILVPSPSDFRWREDGAVSPWFPAMMIHRQQRDGHWQRALDDMGTALYQRSLSRTVGMGLRSGATQA